MSALTARRTYAALAAMQVGDAVACALQVAPIRKSFDDVGLAHGLRPIIPIVKAASAVGLISVYGFPGSQHPRVASLLPAVPRVTTFMLTVYFVLAVAFHVKAKDWSPGLLAASSFLGLFGAMTVKGPAPSP